MLSRGGQFIQIGIRQVSLEASRTGASLRAGSSTTATPGTTGASALYPRKVFGHACRQPSVVLFDTVFDVGLRLEESTPENGVGDLLGFAAMKPGIVAGSR